jgi:hypothetical protein
LTSKSVSFKRADSTASSISKQNSSRLPGFDEGIALPNATVRVSSTTPQPPPLEKYEKYSISLGDEFMDVTSGKPHYFCFFL